MTSPKVGNHRIEEIYEKHKLGIYKHALRKTGDPQTAEDVVQTVFTSLLARGQTSEEGILKLENYVWGIARNATMDALRKLIRDKRTGASLNDAENVGAKNLAVDQTSAPAIVYRTEKEQILRLCAADADPKEKRMFELWTDGWSHQEIAERLDTDKETVDITLNRFMARLRPRFRHY